MILSIRRRGTFQPNLSGDHQQLTYISRLLQLESSTTTKMDEADREIIRNERDASPERFPSGISGNGPQANAQAHRPSNEIERIPTASTSSSSSSERSARARARPDGASHASTKTDLERHPTVVHRVHTARLQHSSTVGRSITGTETRDAKRPLPEMGLGKPYPPDLPAREEYVVEFNGPDDLLHPQNVSFAVILKSTSKGWKLEEHWMG